MNPHNFKVTDQSVCELEQIINDLKTHLDQIDELHQNLRDKIIELYNRAQAAAPGQPLHTTLRSIHFYLHANLGGHYLSYLRYITEAAEMAARLLRSEANAH